MTDILGGSGGQTSVYGALRDMVAKRPWIILSVGGLLFAMTVIFPQVGLLEWVALIPALLAILTLTADPAVGYRRLYGLGLYSSGPSISWASIGFSTCIPWISRICPAPPRRWW